ncbi:MAG: OadG family protein [Spirochaetaceae bacterium]|nr:OadG family protein [Spirochaetaceae bacterium]
MEQTIAFAGTVTILGMGVVFFFLALLSLGMAVLRRVYGGEASAAAAEPAAAAADGAPARHDDRWVAAAVAAWLAGQGQFDEVSAAPWDPMRRRR